VCAREAIGAPSMLRLIRRAGGLGEDVVYFRVESALPLIFHGHKVYGTG